MLTKIFEMSSFESSYKELIVLSNLLYNENIRGCFLEHFMEKVKQFNDRNVKESEVSVLQRLQLKLLEPIMFHIRTSKKSDDKCFLLQCLCEILNITLVSDVNIFFHLYLLLFSQILQNDGLTCQVSEELKALVLESGSCLIKNSTTGLLKNVYKPESAAKLSIGISVSVQTAKEEKSIKLRILALEFLLAVSQFKSKTNYKDTVSKNLGDLFMLYLPGVIAPLQDIILRDETQNHLITVKAVTCWGHIICLVMNDGPSEEQLNENEIIMNWIKTNGKSTDEKDEVVDINIVSKEKKRTKNWLRAAATILKPLILKASEVRKHSNSKCRLELTKVMIKLFDCCSINLESSLTTIIEVIASSTLDKDELVRGTAEAAMKHYELNSTDDKKIIFKSIIKKNLSSVLITLPRILHSGNEKLILVSLKSLLGYLKVLGRTNYLKQPISFFPVLKKLLFVLQLGFELETYPEISIQDFSVWDNDTNSKLWYKSWKNFRNFSDNSVAIHLEEICHVLGQFCEKEMVLDCLLDYYCKNQAHQKESFIILNQIILGFDKIDNHIANQLLDVYLDAENLYLMFEIDGCSCKTLKEAHSNLIKVTLMIEGIGNLAKKLRNAFQDHLLRSLYYIVEKMGSSYCILKNEAVKSGAAVAEACGFEGSITSLIKNNIDYLTYHLLTKIRRNHVGAFDVIIVLMKYCPVESLPNLEEIINSVVSASSKNLSSLLTVTYLRLFHTFVQCVSKLLPVSSHIPESVATVENSITKFINSIKSVEKDIEDIKFDENQPCAEENEGAESQSIDDEYEEIEKPKPPRHVTMIVSVCNHCLHFLASKDENKKIMVLEILNEGVLYLFNWENELLPLVHKIWSPLVTRFDQNSNPLIINRSFTLLCSLARTSKQFIRSRTLKTVLPTLQAFLKKEAENSKLKFSSSGYYFTQKFKLLRNLLDNIGYLATDLDLFEKQMDLIIDSTLPYLSKLQPKELQEKCRKLYCHLKSHDPCLIWFKLHNLTTQQEFQENAKIILNW